MRAYEKVMLLWGNETQAKLHNGKEYSIKVFHKQIVSNKKKTYSKYSYFI